MYTTANMGLTSWNQLPDHFDHTMLDGNWRALDQHDHSVNRGVQIGTAGITTGAITSALIAAQAVGNTQLGTGAVATSNIQTGAITNALLSSGAVFGSAIQHGGVAYNHLDSTILPLGTVMMYWRPTNSNSTPGGGWEVMDGRPWSTISNSLGLTTGNIPDMRGVFPQGADTVGVRGPRIGATGGAAILNLTHHHHIPHHHHSCPPHHHPIGPDGHHCHHWFGGLQMWTRQNALPVGITVNDALSVQRQNTYYTMYLKSLTADLFDLNVDMDFAGDHDHGGFTEISLAFDTDELDLFTDLDDLDDVLEAVEILPPYLGLLFVMRCR